MALLPGRTYAPTLYGAGEDLQDWAQAALQHISGDQIIVVGCSIGGSCALQVAARAPGRVAALVLIGTKAEHRPDPAFHQSATDLLQTNGLEAAWNTYWRPLVSSATRPQAISEIKEMTMRQSLAGIVGGVNVFHTRPSRTDILESFDGPVHIITGADDPTPGIEVAKAQAAQARHGHLHIIPDCGHYVPMEQPEKLNAILRDVTKTVEGCA